MLRSRGDRSFISWVTQICASVLFGIAVGGVSDNTAWDGWFFGLALYGFMEYLYLLVRDMTGDPE